MGESQYSHYNYTLRAFVVTLTDVQLLLYLQDHGCYYMLIDTCTLSKMFNDYYNYLQGGLGNFLSGLLMQLAKYAVYNHCLVSLSEIMVTTQ